MPNLDPLFLSIRALGGGGGIRSPIPLYKTSNSNFAYLDP